MNVETTAIPGLLVITPKVFGDARGFFFETWQQERYEAAGVREVFVQDNLSRSAHGVLRGLHYQTQHTQGKLVQVLEGEVYDVAVDLRAGSPTFGQWHAEVLSADNRKQFWVPAGFAHGFCVTSEFALFAYKCSDRYHPQSEVSLLWNDPALGIPWPITEPTLSEKDRNGIALADLQRGQLPTVVFA